MTPAVLQIGEYLDRTRGTHDLGAAWLATVASHLLAGMPWSHGRRGLDPAYPELIDVLRGAPLGLCAVAGAATAALALGAARLVAAGGVRALLVPALVLPAPLTWLLGWLRGENLFPWYLVFALPPSAALVSIGLVSAVPRRLGRAGAPAAALAFLAGFAWLTQVPRETLRAHSFKPVRDAVALTRPVDPEAPENRGILTAYTREFDPRYYDPRGRWVATPADVEALERRADAEGLTLFVDFGRLERIEKHTPTLLALVEGPQFEPVALLHGFEPPWTRKVWRYRGGGKPRPAEPPASPPAR
jgi:hypothetical protein